MSQKQDFSLRRISAYGEGMDYLRGKGSYWDEPTERFFFFFMMNKKQYIEKKKAHQGRFQPTERY